MFDPTKFWVGLSNTMPTAGYLPKECRDRVPISKHNVLVTHLAYQLLKHGSVSVPFYEATDFFNNIFDLGIHTSVNVDYDPGYLNGFWVKIKEDK